MLSSTVYLACSSSSEKDEGDDDAGSGGTGGASGGASGKSNTGGKSNAGSGSGAVSAGEDSDSGGDGPVSGVGGSGGSNAAGKGGTGGKGGAGGSQTGAGKGGGSGASGGAGTGSSEDAGLVTFDTFAFYNPALVSGADGVLHLAFNTNTSPSDMEYAECSADCGVGANWAVTVVGTHEFTGHARLVVDSHEGLHLLYDVSATSGPEQLIYATCASQCTDSSNWTATDLAPLFGGGWVSPDYGAPMVIDDEDRLSFTVDRKIYTDGGVSLATCASNCNSLDSWSTGTISATGTRTSLAARGTTLYQILDNAAGNGIGNALGYRTCAANCTDASSWEELKDVFVYDGLMPNALAVTAEGGVRVAYNQGQSDSGQPAEVRAQDNSLLIWGCDADCLDVSSWTGFVSGNVNDGAKGISMAELGGALVLSVSNDDRVIARACAEDCLVDTSWTEGDIDTSEAMSADYDPYVYASCDGHRPLIASWQLTQGVTTIRPNGSVAFAHTASMLQTCTGSSSVEYLPGFGRVVYLP